MRCFVKSVTTILELALFSVTQNNTLPLIRVGALAVDVTKVRLHLPYFSNTCLPKSHLEFVSKLRKEIEVISKRVYHDSITPCKRKKRYLYTKGESFVLSSFRIFFARKLCFTGLLN